MILRLSQWESLLKSLYRWFCIFVHFEQIWTTSLPLSHSPNISTDCRWKMHQYCGRKSFTIIHKRFEIRRTFLNLYRYGQLFINFNLNLCFFSKMKLDFKGYFQIKSLIQKNTPTLQNLSNYFFYIHWTIHWFLFNLMLCIFLKNVIFV